MLACNGVSLHLECSDATLCHPLLSACSMQESALYTTNVEHSILLQHGSIRALYDIAIQTGVPCFAQALQIETPVGAVRSVAVVPLECSGGILGFFLCTDSREEAFSHDMYLQLEQSVPVLAQQLEMILYKRYVVVSLYEQNERILEDDILLDIQEPGEFISLMSHELRVPLTAIKGYAGLLQAYSLPEDVEGHVMVVEGVKTGRTVGAVEAMEAAMTPERQRQYLNGIMEQTHHLEVLVRDLLDLARQRPGRLALHCTQVDIAQLCVRVAQLIQHRVGQQPLARHTIHCQVDPDLPLVWADPDRVEQVLTNLVDNALKYSPHGGRIEIQASLNTPLCGVPAPLMVDIAVCDEGIGISVQQQKELFQPFKRIGHPETRDVPGFGLGLYLAHKLIEAMHGSMILSSSENKGTSVRFTLPVEPAHALAARCVS